MLSSSLLSDCADTGFAAAFAVLSSSSRRRMACFGVDIRLWKLEFGLGIGLLLLEFLIRITSSYAATGAGRRHRTSACLTICSQQRASLPARV
ncbi:hypothetical protein KCU72_g30, partial [Aureobasidium melanogenum]